MPVFCETCGLIAAQRDAARAECERLGSCLAAATDEASYETKRRDDALADCERLRARAEARGKALEWFRLQHVGASFPPGTTGQPGEWVAVFSDQMHTPADFVEFLAAASGVDPALLQDAAGGEAGEGE
jgi:hypothetical protein